MKVTPHVLLISILLASLAGLHAAETPALPEVFKAKDSKIQLIGRFDLRNENPRCAWAGSAIVARFRGTDLNLLLKDSAKGDTNKVTGFNNDYLTVRVDGGEPTTLRLESDRERYAVATGLAPGEHSMRVSKRTEPICGEVTLLGLEISAGGKLINPPARPERRIEFIGDSITCGYGNEAPDEKQNFAPATENNDLAYGAITARRFGAEYVCIAWSGIGVYRNHNGDVMSNMNTRYDKILKSDPTAIWDFTEPKPQVVVINLGENDFAKGDPGQDYIDAYEKLVATVRRHYPQATIFFALGSMAKGEKAVKNQEYLEKIIADLKDPKFFFASLGSQEIQKNGAGANWHPSLKTHAIMAELLAKVIEEKTDWKSLP